jgi:hypothetical protein
MRSRVCHDQDRTSATVLVTARQRIFCSCSGTAHFQLRQPRLVLSSGRRGWADFIDNQFSNPAEPQRANACGFFNGGYAQVAWGDVELAAL